MKTKQLNHIIKHLVQKGIEFDNGLTDKEVLQIEDKFNFKFPPDLRFFLQTALPASYGFVNWRLGLHSEAEAQQINLHFDAPLNGMLFDIKHNNFWVDSWGEMPDYHENKVQIAKKHYNTYPKLIPIYSHRFIPSEPCEKDNPVFSVYQMDIIYFGYDLASYFANEFKFTLIDDFEPLQKPKKVIEFWSTCAET